MASDLGWSMGLLGYLCGDGLLVDMALQLRKEVRVENVNL